MARQESAHLHIVHGLQLPVAETPVMAPPERLNIALQREAANRLDALVEAQKHGGIEVTSALRLEPAAAAIVAEAEKEEADLVVIGTRGLGGMHHVLVGSIAQRVVRRAQCPVLTVHPGDHVPDKAFRHVLLATDLSEHSVASIRRAAGLLASLSEPPKLTLFSAFHMSIEYMAYSEMPAAWDYLTAVRSDTEQRLAKLAQELQAEGHDVETTVREGSAHHEIVAQATTRNADLIAMGTHGRAGLGHFLLGSTAERVLQHAGCPVLVVRPPESED